MAGVVSTILYIMSTQDEGLIASITDLLKTYKPADETIALVQSTPTVLLVGISGAGKDTIKHKLLKTGKYHEMVSHTTRTPRTNHGVLEQDGVEYHFIGLPEARKMLENGEYVEAKIYGDKIYGTSVAEVQKARDDGKVALNDIEVQGVAEYKALSQNVTALFIVPPTYEAWRERLLNRYGDDGADPEDLNKRMHAAVGELEHALAVDYYHFIINDDIDRAVQAIDTIAHNHGTFNDKDDWARGQATALLLQVRTNKIDI